MENAFYYIDGDGTEHMIYMGGQRVVRYVEWRSEFGLGARHTLHSEKLPGKYANATRGVTYPSRVYGYKLFVQTCDGDDLDAMIEELEAWHDTELGIGYVKRVNRSGEIRCLDAYLQSIEVSGYQGGTPCSAMVTLTYLADVPWWRDESMSSASDVFNDAVNVPISCANGGDIPAATYVTITGIIDTPKLTNSDGDWIELRTSNDEAADVIIADCLPSGATRRTVKNYEDGVGAGVFVQTTGGSKLLSLPTGTHDVTVVAASGNATCLIEWYNYYRSLF